MVLQPRNNTLFVEEMSAPQLDRLLVLQEVVEAHRARFLHPPSYLHGFKLAQIDHISRRLFLIFLLFEPHLIIEVHTEVF